MQATVMLAIGLALLLVLCDHCIGHLEPCETTGRLGWISDGQSCYYISASLNKASETEQECFGKGGNLASIHCDVETRYLTDAISKMGVLDASFMQTSYSIGLHDVSKDSKNRIFLWTDGTPYDYQKWLPGEPNSINEHCVELFTNGFWNDLPCNAGDMSYICKVTEEHTAGAGVKRCWATGKEEWISDGQSCYFISGDNRTLEEAQASCRYQNANLLSLHGSAESQFVVMAAANFGRRFSHWIGLRTDLPGSYQWLDGTVVDYQNWFQGQPNSENKLCVEMFITGAWSQALCEDLKGFICKQVKASGMVSANKPGRSYPHGNFVYTFSEIYNISNFMDAKRICNQSGAQLMSIHSQDEAEFLINTTRILFHGLSRRTSYWIGMQQTRDGSYSWTDGTPFDFQKWFTAPTNQANKTCFEMLSIGNWSSASCTDRKPYICKASDNRVPASWLSSETNVTVVFIIGGVIIAVLAISWIVYGVVWYIHKRGRTFVDKRKTRSATAEMPDYEKLRLRGVAETGQRDIFDSEHEYSNINAAVCLLTASNLR